MRAEEMLRSRSKEIELMIDCISKLDDGNKLCSGSLSNILKSNSVLMIYNMIEATVARTVEELYESIGDAKLKCGDLTKEIRNVWLNTILKKAYNKNSSYDTYLKTSVKIIDCILSKEVISMETNKPLSGNVDSKSLRKFCKEHDIPDKADDTNGVALDYVKRKRNSLAHGEFSFEEVGRDFTIKDIENYYRGAEGYLKQFISSVDEYIKKIAFRTIIGEDVIHNW